MLTSDNVNISELVERLGSDEDAVRKMAVFKLQSNIGDPSFADMFIAEGGLLKLKFLTMHATGNTLAYSLTSFSRLLDVDKGWEVIDEGVVERVGSSLMYILWPCADFPRSSTSSCRTPSSTSSAAQCPSSSPSSRTPMAPAAPRKPASSASRP